MRNAVRVGSSRIPDPASDRFGERGPMAKAAVASHGVDLEPIDRLENKVKLLVGVVDRLRAEGAQEKQENGRLRAESTQAKEENSKLRADAAREKDENARLRAEGARAAEENTRLRADLESLRGRLSDAEGSGAELTALREEREHIRGRVADMLQQIEALNL
jgi:predicted RNase H-like nuclease (RuvC/YqgF family)